MGEFFHGWRRKVGCLTLVMACLFMAGWVRSRFVYDWIEVNTKPSRLSISSGWGQIRLWGMSHQPTLPTYRYSIGEELIGIDVRGTPEWRIDFAGFQLSDQFHLCFIPYWSITVPLTLISLWLLLSKPRNSTQNKITEPVPAEGR